MLRHRIFHACTRRLSAMAVLAAALACGGGAAAGSQSGVPDPRPSGTAIRLAQADTGPTLAGPNPGADPIIGASDVLAPPETLTLVHPFAVTTARLQADGTSVTLSGIDGEGGDAAQGLQGYLDAAGDRVDCRPQGDGHHVCVTPDGTDIAEVALVNGAARTRPEAPDAYREQEFAAQTARRGLWANLPPPPETLRHPMVRDTATLASATQTYPLDGVIGQQAPFADALQDYIAAHGDSVTCSPQGDTGNYVCVLPDGIDVAKVALINGAARAEPDAPDAYREQQLDALNNRRGIWLAAANEDVTEAQAPPPRTGYGLAAGDDGADGIGYAGGTPMAAIGGAPVFLAFGAGVGWGYYDQFRHWHAAPGPYRAHLEQFHPEGRGLPGHGPHRDVMQDEAALQPRTAFHRESAWAGPPVRPEMPGAGHPPPFGTSGHPGMVESLRQDHPWINATAGHPGMSGPPVRPEMPGAGRPPPFGPIGHPGMVEPLRQDHPWINATAGHPGMSGPAFQHRGSMAMAAPRFAPPQGGGFTNQRPGPQGGFRPGAPAQAMRAAEPAPHGNTAAGKRR